MKGNKDLNSSSPHHHLSLSLRTSRNHQTTKTNLIILSTPGMLQPRKKRRSLTRFIPPRLESSSLERLRPTLLLIRGSSCTGWRPLRWLINWRKPSLPSVKTILYWEKKNNFLFSRAVSKWGDGWPIWDYWDGWRDLLRYSGLQTIRRLHNFAHDVMLIAQYNLK